MKYWIPIIGIILAHEKQDVFKYFIIELIWCLYQGMSIGGILLWMK